jgi:large subunit ribosomal protein L1|uniref:Large ribosomal subunit protein uL1c n=2 Tax=Heterosigma akashiwo TaxID=2829 RepID=B2XT38_HETAK|nr:ribosomal protein L1 [Heterosigma akashiwo]ABV65936.1 50S ribosomal protein L1 [Heterosigma akashiwo]ABV70081.1 50S ribosomal protein L1 [Heterosigma akashiwo]BBA18152.1 50S ribosomal protein L1 [Heterosigma akashiwo]BBA18293.1 50S ribosomal protein L1 [Heterosigma akashiwo]BBA18432.1 50S ribosomal protein L1 [Heterosigma akashiwo]|mmetsp:Transcript_33706/g.49343  ORF Transcript_33706/g.49343 Transcript_33706/m.49343 type:complete len:230 (+) Transcript_33706:520-1209(+)
MKKLSKRLQKLNNLVEKKLYSVDESIKLLKETATASFVESTEAHISLNIDPKYADQQLRTTLVLPNGTGKTVRLAVLIPDEKIKPEYKQQADIVGSNDLIEKITKGDIDFDILIASPDMMPKLAKLGRVLGPKGLMPSPKSGTVTDDISETINQFKKGKIEYKADRTGIVHLNFGKSNFTNEQLLQNLLAFYNSVEQNKPSGVKGKYFKSFYICNTMGPSIQIDLTSMV